MQKGLDGAAKIKRDMKQKAPSKALASGTYQPST